MQGISVMLAPGKTTEDQVAKGQTVLLLISDILRQRMSLPGAGTAQMRNDLSSHAMHPILV